MLCIREEVAQSLPLRKCISSLSKNSYHSSAHMRCLWPSVLVCTTQNTHKLANTHKCTHNGHDSGCSVLVWVTFSSFSRVCSLCGIKCLAPDHSDYCTFNWGNVKVCSNRTIPSRWYWRLATFSRIDAIWLQITGVRVSSSKLQTCLPLVISSHAESFSFIYRFWDFCLHHWKTSTATSFSRNSVTWG